MAGEAALAVASSTARVHAATGDWSAARTRATTLAKLEVRHGVVEQAAAERAEQLVLDEAAARGHRAKAADESATPTPKEER